MRKIYLLLAAVALAVSSCQKDADGGGKTPTEPAGTIPADFDWKTIQDVSVTVAAPVVEGGTPAYSVIRVYASPILSEENVVAKGVATAAAPFSTAVSIPAGTQNLYVQTTLPDGRKAVKMVAAGASVNVPGAAMAAAASPKVRFAAKASSVSSMPDYPTMTEPDAGSFAPQAVISTTPSKNFNLGAKESEYAAAAYYIPAGAVIDGNINLQIPAPVVKNEAFIIPSDVCFAGKAVDPRRLDLAVDGTWGVAAGALSFDYLWNEIRVKGGAYGCGFRCAADRQLAFYTYRDPAIDPSLERIDHAGAWLRSFDPAPEVFEGFIVSCVSGHDAPAKPYGLARRQDGEFFAKRPVDWRETRRNAMLSATPEKVRALADDIERVAANAPVCIFGGREIIEASTAGLTPIDLLG